MAKRSCNRYIICGNGEEMKEKVVVLRELQRTIIYTNELNKQAMECHVSRAFIVYSVNEGARLTESCLKNYSNIGKWSPIYSDRRLEDV
jgi:hypothetical protein